MKKRRAIRRKVTKQNKLAMIGISLVVCILLVVLLFEGYSLRVKIKENNAKIESLHQQTEEEEARTGEIEDLQDIMHSDEYYEKIAKEKIGLVKENEILFKENN